MEISPISDECRPGDSYSGEPLELAEMMHGHISMSIKLCGFDTGLIWLVQLVMCSTVRCRYNAANFPAHIHKRHPIAHPPVWTSYGVSFVDPISDRCSATVPVIIYVISYNIGPRYNGTRLYSPRNLYLATNNLQMAILWLNYEY